MTYGRIAEGRAALSPSRSVLADCRKERGRDLIVSLLRPKGPGTVILAVGGPYWSLNGSSKVRQRIPEGHT